MLDMPKSLLKLQSPGAGPTSGISISDAGFDRATASRVWWTCFQNFSPPKKYWLPPPPESSKIFFPKLLWKKIPPGGVWSFLAHDFLHPATCRRCLKKNPPPSARPKKRRGSLQLMSFFRRKLGHLKTTLLGMFRFIYGIILPSHKQPIFSMKSNTLRDHPTGCWPGKMVPLWMFRRWYFPMRKSLEKSLACEKVSLILDGFLQAGDPTGQKTPPKKESQTNPSESPMSRLRAWHLIFGCFRK